MVVNDLTDEVVITDCPVGFVGIAIARNTGIVLFNPVVAIALFSRSLLGYVQESNDTDSPTDISLHTLQQVI